MSVEQEAHTENEDEIFHAKALEQLNNPSQLDVMLQVIPPKAWLLLLTIIGLLVVVFLWSLFGSIPVKIEGKGIVISSKGLFSVQDKVAGTVNIIHVHPGQVVEKGALIAELSDPDKELQLVNNKKKLTKLQTDLDTLKEEIDRESAASNEATNREIAAKEFTIKQIENDIVNGIKSVEKKKKLVEEGLISKSELNKSEDNLIAKRIELESTKAGLATLKAKLVQGYRTEEYKSKEQQVLKVSEEKDLLESSLAGMKVYSPFPGRVLDWLVNLGDLVTPGTPLVWMEHLTANEPISYIILGYLPIEKGKRVQIGDRVEIELTTVNTEEYGYMIGKISSVSQYAVSQKNISKVIQNEGLANYLTGGNNVVIQVMVEIEKDPNSLSGYKWTSGLGPALQISTGTICKLRTIIERVRPLFYAFPVWHFKFASDSPEIEKNKGTE